MNQNIFAGQLDKTIEVTPIRQLRNWCWIDSGHMMLRKYLEDNGKLSSDESIYERYGDECVDEAANYNGGYRKNKEEFEQLYENIFIKKSLSLGVVLGNSPTEQQKKQVESLQSVVNNLNDNPTDKDAAFLVYLSSGFLNKNNYNEIFNSSQSDQILKAVNIVLKAAGLEEKRCFTAQAFCECDWKFSVINYALSKDSSIVSLDSGHFKVIDGIEDNKVRVQETGGAQAKLLDANDYLSKQNELLFIDDVNIGRNDDRLEGIWSVKPNENIDGVTYKKGEEISVFLDLGEDVNKINLVNKDKNIEFTKTYEVLMTTGTEGYGKMLWRYTAKTLEDISLRDLIDNYHFDEGAK